MDLQVVKSDARPLLPLVEVVVVVVVVAELLLTSESVAFTASPSTTT